MKNNIVTTDYYRHKNLSFASPELISAAVKFVIIDQELTCKSFQ